MSTRGTFGVRIKGQDKLMYNHSDSYPGGLGVELLAVLRKLVKKPGLEKLKEQAQALVLVDENSPKPTAEQKEKLAPYANFGVDDGKPDNWYCLTRNLQGDLAKSLEVGINRGSGDFILDSLFCEWAYIVNLDTNKLEVYEGFQEKPHDKGRYGDKTNWDGRGSKYYGCALVAEFDLDKLPTDSKFLKAVEKEEEE